MSILERPASSHAPAAEGGPPSDRLRVITAGRVGNMDASLGANGFEVVAAAQTQDALIDAVSADEPDAIVVEADMCTSLEHIRDLAPDAVLIVVGDHTPAGALGRIELGVSGTVMARLLHALVAEGVGAAAVWGLVPAFQPGAEQHVLQHMGGSLLWAKADLVRGFLVNAVNALRDHAELVTAASTVAAAVSAGVLLTLSGPRTEERPARVLVPASAVERAPVEPAQTHPVFAVSPTTPTSTHGPSGNEGEPGDRRGPNRGDSRDLGRHDGPGENEHDQGEDNDDQGVNEGSDDQVMEEGNDDDVVEEGNDPHGQSEDPHGQSEDPHGQKEDDHGQNEDPHGQNEGDHGKNEDDHGVNQDNDDQGENESEGDQAEESDDQGENEDDQGEDEGNDDQGEDTDPITPL
jgi:DNA-binding NarL/FixJ family response regulator